MKYIPTIGLEIHLQLNTQSKIFCACSNKGENEPPNTTICPTCTGHPGTLPTINKEAVKSVMKAGMALHSTINTQTKFDRKNYFYPDLPKGYQISQYDIPLCQKGWIFIGEKKIGITRIHLEEDTAKLIHSEDGKHTFVDFNRSGSPLMELVTEPDIATAKEAKTLSQELHRLFRSLRISDADMEKGHMRCEANISIRPKNRKKLGTKVEVKNINSFKALEKAIVFEIERQSRVLDSGEKVAQETRGWSDVKMETVSQRKKENAHDYRYFPEPDLPPLNMDASFLEEVKREIPELPAEKRNRFCSEYGVNEDMSLLLTKTDELADWFEHVASELRSWVQVMEHSEKEEENWNKKKGEIMKLVAGWLTSEIFKHLKQDGRKITELRFTPENFAELIILLYEKKINSTAGQAILTEMYRNGGDPTNIMEEKNLGQVDDETTLINAIEQVLKEYPAQVEQYKKGKTPLLQFFLGKVMSATKGKANPERTKQLLKEKLQ